MLSRAGQKRPLTLAFAGGPSALPFHCALAQRLSLSPIQLMLLIMHTVDRM